MPIKRHKGIGGIIAGALLIGAGGYFIAFPTSGIILHHDAESGGYFPEWVSRNTSQVYGFFGVVFGAGVIWFARWPRWGARRTAIDEYVWSLSQELSRHFGTKKYYSVDEVSRIAGEFGCQMAYIAYAHAMFCSRSDFDAYYGPLRVACTYDGLRDVIGRRYFDGGYGFDAATVVRLAAPPKQEEYADHGIEGG